MFDTRGESDVLLRTVRHTYYAIGTVCNISIQDEWIEGVTPGDPNDYERWHDLGLFYYTNGQLWRAQWSTFKVGPFGKVVPGSHEVDRMREFRYDDPTERYLVADFDSGVADPNTVWPAPTLEWPVQWTDYMGGPAADSDVDYDDGPPKTWTLTGSTEYLPNLHGEIENASGNATYYHGDLIGSTSLLTHRDGQGGQAAAPATTAYTAFGEAVIVSSAPDPNDPNGVVWSATVGDDLPSGFPRYGYAGQYGYESGFLSVNGPNTNLPPITLQHLGWRWYDPGLGRFLQRDPIGISGGHNPFLYTACNPLIAVDPAGLFYGDDWDDPVGNGLAEAWRWLLGDEWLVNATNTDIVVTSTAYSVALTASGCLGVVAGTPGAGFVAGGFSEGSFFVSSSTVGWRMIMGGLSMEISGQGRVFQTSCVLPARYPNSVRDPGINASNCFWGMVWGIVRGM